LGIAEIKNQNHPTTRYFFSRARITIAVITTSKTPEKTKLTIRISVPGCGYIGASPTGQTSILKYCAYATMAFSNRTENEYAATLCLTALATWTAPPRVCACIVIAALA
jgi:hypothetical protein